MPNRVRRLTRKGLRGLLGSVLTLLLSAAGSAWAGSATSPFSVTATVSANCTIDSAPIAFGAYDPIVDHSASPLDGTGSVTITCNKNTVATIGLNAGNNSGSAVGTTRAMKSGASDYLSYEIYQDSGRTTLWGNSGGDLLAPPAAPSNAPRAYTTYGRVPAGQDAPLGSYSDTVTATVNF